MNVVGVIMRVYSYLFHLLLALVLLALSGVTMLGGVHNMQLNMLPWKEATLTYPVLALGLIGLVLVLMAVKGWLRVVFFVWSLVVFGLLVKGYIFSQYIFAGSAELTKVLIFIFASLLAALGAWMSWRQAPVKH